MPPIRSLASERHACIVVVILLFSKIMPSCSRYEEKKLVYIIIMAFFSRQPSSCVKCSKSNIYLFYNIRSISDAECL